MRMPIIPKNLLLIGSVCLVLLTTGCVVTRDALTFSSRNENTTEVVLAKNNYKVVSTVSGEISQNYLFGFIGGFSKKAMRESAISDMYKNANLTGAQAIIYINVSFKYELVLPLFMKTTAVASGIVIEFTN